jgi:hypothetical protein
MIQSSGIEWRRYLPRHYLTPKYVLLLTFFNSAAEGVATTDICADRTSEWQVSTALILKFLVFRELYAV